jgi:hypothetical protein
VQTGGTLLVISDNQYQIMNFRLSDCPTRTVHDQNSETQKPQKPKILTHQVMQQILSITPVLKKTDQTLIMALGLPISCIQYYTNVVFDLVEIHSAG